MREGKRMYPYEPDQRLSLKFLANEVSMREGAFIEDWEPVFWSTFGLLKQYGLLKEEKIAWVDEPSIWEDEWDYKHPNAVDTEPTQLVLNHQLER